MSAAPDRGTLAVTGATGFVGTNLVERAVAEGWQVRALTRRPQPPRAGVTWVDGALDAPDRLAELVAGSDAVVHLAGLVSARDRAAFHAANALGARAAVTAARMQGVRRFVHVSSLSAREPGLSDYGWSKAMGEAEVMASGIDWTIVRPPAIYGPHDTEMRELFRMAARGFVVLPPRGRFSVIAAADLAALLLALAADRGETVGTVIEPDDGRPRGWSHRTFALALGKAVGRSVSTLSVPARLLKLAARGDRLVRRGRAKLTPDRAAYFCHPDWTIDPARRPPAHLWTPRIDTPRGLADTARWYRANGWL